MAVFPLMLIFPFQAPASMWISIWELARGRLGTWRTELMAEPLFAQG